MHIKLDLEDLTLDDLEALEDAKLNPNEGVWSQLRAILARFCYESDEEDAPRVEYEEAIGRMGGVSLRRIRELMGELTLALEEVAQKAIPPTTDEQS